jgi:uncharacterized protein
MSPATPPTTPPTASLSADEQAGYLASIARVGERVAEALRPVRSAAPAAAFVVHLYRNLDAVVAAAHERGAAIECRAGCDACCHLRVEVTEAELITLALHLRHWPAPELAALRTRLQVPAPHAASAPSPPCALLQDHRCSVYEVRPAACRKAHSLSAADCQARAPLLPQDLKLLLDAEALMQGTAQGYRRAGWAASRLELQTALRQVLAEGMDMDVDVGMDVARTTADPESPRPHRPALPALPALARWQHGLPMCTAPEDTQNAADLGLTAGPQAPSSR